MQDHNNSIKEFVFDQRLFQAQSFYSHIFFCVKRALKETTLAWPHAIILKYLKQSALIFFSCFCRKFDASFSLL
jgi:hypothetical protein